MSAEPETPAFDEARQTAYRTLRMRIDAWVDMGDAAILGDALKAAIEVVYFDTPSGVPEELAVLVAKAVHETFDGRLGRSKPQPVEVAPPGTVPWRMPEEER